jgi:hypothetical protein
MSQVLTNYGKIVEIFQSRELSMAHINLVHRLGAVKSKDDQKSVSSLHGLLLHDAKYFSSKMSH